MDNLHHPFDFLRRDRPRAALFPQEIHYVRGELVTGLKQRTESFTFHLLPEKGLPETRHGLCEKRRSKNIVLFRIGEISVYCVFAGVTEGRTKRSEIRRKVLGNGSEIRV